MENFERNAIKIDRYLHGKMSGRQEEAFMDELGENEDLRNQYEDELLLHALFRNEETEVAVVEKKRTPVIALFSNYKSIAAAAIVIVASITVFLIANNKHNTPQTATATNNPTKTNTLPNPAPTAQNNFADTIFKQYYKQYTGAQSPVEIGDYLTAYQNGDYKKVLAATDADYQTMGVNDRKDLLKQYMYLYKGLSYLEQNKPDSAATQFNLVLHSAPNSSPQYYDAQWYNMLSSLKKNDLKTASERANLISLSSSPYKNRAGDIAKKLTNK